MKLYNTLSRTVEDFIPIHEKTVGLYACGFTTYDYTHLGHLRKYSMDDVLVRMLRYAGFTVNFVQNITDVGHLSSDADTGEDKLEKGAKKYGKTVWEIAQQFEEYFWMSMDSIGNFRPNVSCRATEHIQEQLQMVIELEKKGFAYVIEGDGVYFDTSKFADYGKLARLNLSQQKEGARIEANAQKRNPTDFALWKFEREGENRAMIWESPWHQRSFPGWHIECSAMAIKYLGQQFDIHTGGIDHIPVHHTNEIAQSEAYSGKAPFVRYWVHHNFLRVNGEKMSKSLGNFFTIDDVRNKGFDSQALRLLFLSTHYRSEMNFTWENLAGTQTAWNKLKTLTLQFKNESERTVLSEEKLEKVNEYRQRFFGYMEDDLRTAEAVAVLWEVVKSNIPGRDKYDLLVEFDQVFGLGLTQINTKQASDGVQTSTLALQELPPSVQQLIEKRETARALKDWAESDKIRQELTDQGYSVLDTANGIQIHKL